MAVPAVVAFKERDNILQLAMYAFLAIAVLYTFYKLFGLFKEVGEKVEEAKEKVENFMNDAKNEVKYRIEHPTEAPVKMAKAIVKPETPVEKFQRYAFNLLPGGAVGTAIIDWWMEKHETKRVVPRYQSTQEIMKNEGERWKAKADSHFKHYLKEYHPKARNISMKEYTDIQAKRWEAIAKHYRSQEKKKKPLPVFRPLPYNPPVFAR